MKRPVPLLTKREREVLSYAARGFSAAETGEALEVSRRTVEVHIRSAKLRLNAKSITHAVVVALRKKEISA